MQKARTRTISAGQCADRSDFSALGLGLGLGLGDGGTARGMGEGGIGLEALREGPAASPVRPSDAPTTPNIKHGESAIAQTAAACSRPSRSRGSVSSRTSPWTSPNHTRSERRFVEAHIVVSIRACSRRSRRFRGTSSSTRRGAAYDDRALPLMDGQTISQPDDSSLSMLAAEHRSALEVGAGSGYAAALLRP